MATFSPQEVEYYDGLFTYIDKSNSGILPGQDALPFLVSSSLPQQALGEIWALVDPDNNGFLTKDAWYKAARLIGWSQSGSRTVDESLALKAGPLPKFANYPLPSTTIPIISKASLPTITPADRAKFTRIFAGCSPQNGLVTGERARNVFVKSQLPYEKLAKIWNLADTQQRGSLDLTDFIIGMFLIQTCMAATTELPAQLPRETYQQASGGRSIPQTVTPQRTGSVPISPLRPSQTGTSAQWDVSPAAKATSDQFFSQLDPQNRGTIEGDVAVSFMVQSQLDEATLASIWDLADMRHEGRLDREQFAVAMHLINAKLAGHEVPPTLPPGLIPPHLRGTPISPADHNTTSVTKDLFDLFADDEPSAPIPSFPIPPPPQPTEAKPSSSRDLLEDATGPQEDLAAKTRELTEVSGNLEESSNEHRILDEKSSDLATQITEIEQKLSLAHKKNEEETKAVDELRNRVNEQTTQLQQLRAESISAESEVSALKSEKDELGQTLLRDREEVRGLQKRMQEFEEEKAKLNTLLEKIRKDSRQQRGMITIAKKQLSTAETSRDNVQRDLDASSSSRIDVSSPDAVDPLPVTAIDDPQGPPDVASSIPLPATPHALSPAPTGVSQRSNNPFDRFGSNFGHKPNDSSITDQGASSSFDAAFADLDSDFAHEAQSPSAGPVEVTEDRHSALFADEKKDEDSKGVVDAAMASPIDHGEQNTAVPVNDTPTRVDWIEPRAESGTEEVAATSDIAIPSEELVSSDDDQGPEDIDALPVHQSLTSEKPSTPLRRAAPAPPSATSPVPLEQPLSPSNVVRKDAPPFTDATFDDFDFPDMPSARVDSGPSASAFDDEFAVFEDSNSPFGSQRNTDSEHSVSKSYEIVPAKTTDEWGMEREKGDQTAGISFDDAFGGDFAPTKQVDVPQPDDIEDVKKLCSMGFSRSLVIEALAANGYDFQKALNVLLAQ